MSALDYQELYQLRTIKEQLEVVVSDLNAKGLSATIGAEGRLALDKVTRDLAQILEWESGRNAVHRAFNGHVSAHVG